MTEENQESSESSAFADYDPNQALLPGMRRYVPAPPRDYRPWTDGRGNKIDSPAHRGATFYGAVVPLPTNARGELLELGDFRVLARTDGRYVVVDRTAEFGDFTNEVVCGSQARAEKQLLICHRARTCKGPLWIVRDRRGRPYELGRRTVLRRADGAYVVLVDAFGPKPVSEGATLSLREAATHLIACAKAEGARSSTRTP